MFEIVTLSAVLVGIGQGLVLRQHLPQPAGWFWATTGGTLVGVVVVGSVLGSVIRSLGQRAGDLTGLVSFGAAVGGLQGLVLAGQGVSGAGWWVAASAVGCLLGGGVCSIMDPMSRWIPAWVAAWATYGAVTGAILAQLLIRDSDFSW